MPTLGLNDRIARSSSAELGELGARVPRNRLEINRRFAESLSLYGEAALTEKGTPCARSSRIRRGRSVCRAR